MEGVGRDVFLHFHEGRAVLEGVERDVVLHFHEGRAVLEGVGRDVVDLVVTEPQLL